MKKLIILVFAMFTSIALIGCDSASLASLTDDFEMDSQTSLVSLSYLSAGFLDLNTSTDTKVMEFALLADGEEPVVEEDLDEINVYFDLLKSFIDNGSTNFGNIELEISDRLEFANKINVSVGEDIYVLYFNVDVTTGEITGIFVIGDIEYTITASNSLDDSEEFEDEYDDEDEDDMDDEDEFEDEDEEEIEDEDEMETEDEMEAEDETEDEVDSEVGASEATDIAFNLSDDSEAEVEDDSNEQKMELVATNGEDTIRITYKVETDGNEQETKFVVKKDIGGVESEIQVKISSEDDEYKVELEDGENHYQFKQEMESDGNVYKLEYEVNGVEGEIVITETTDDTGNAVYEYKIKEGDKEKQIDKDEPESDGFDHEDDENEEENESEEEIAFQM
ncbi:MAG: hypothetical protein KAH13_00865 [Tenericutes bacterium]|nr:hypothetical protein [Mycoplasmatota bacterium]